MALNGLTFDPLRTYGKEYILMALKIAVGAAGAVASVDGKGWKSDGTAAAGINNGSVTKEATAGQYTVVLPGSGSVHDVMLLGCHLEDAADFLVPRIESKDLSARSLTLQLLDPGLAGGEPDSLAQEFQKTNADSAAGDATAETALGLAPSAMTLTEIKYVPATALTADDTNYATITVSKRDSDGGNKTTVASVTTQITGGSGDWTAWAGVNVPISVASVAADSSLTFEIAKAGSGVKVPAGRLVVVGTVASADAGSLVANPSEGTVLHLSLLVKNSNID